MMDESIQKKLERTIDSFKPKEIPAVLEKAGLPGANYIIVLSVPSAGGGREVASASSENGPDTLVTLLGLASTVLQIITAPEKPAGESGH